MTPVAATYTERVLFLRGKFSLLAALATAFVLTGLCLTTTTTSSAAAPSTVYAETSDQVVTTRAAKRWPGKRITYTDYTARPGMVKQAVKAWNGATKGVRLVRKKRGGQIKILAKQCPQMNTACAYGPGDGRVYMGKGWKKPTEERDLYPTELLIHEIGHALGLPHAGWSCSIMQPYLGDWARACREDRPQDGQFYWYACPPQAVDAKRLARLYRTKPKTNGYCRGDAITPAPPPTVIDGW